MMRITHILPALALLTALLAGALSCTPVEVDPGLTDNTIRISAVDAQTKAALTGDDFTTAGNQLKIFGRNSGNWFINGAIAEYGPVEDPTGWWFQNVDEPYVWQESGVHVFFGWLAKDVKTNTVLAPTYNSAGPDVVNTSYYRVTIPQTTIDLNQQFDFMYSNSMRYDTPPADGVVELSFFHLLSSMNFKIHNQTGEDITVQSITFSGYDNNKGATIDFPNTTDLPSITITGTPSDTPGSLTFDAQNSSVLAGETSDVITPTLLLWPIDKDESASLNYTITVNYKIGNESKTATNDEVPSTSFACASGNQYTYALELQPGEEPGVTVSSNVVVAPWGDNAPIGDSSASGSQSDYIIFDKDVYEMKNENSIVIPFKASGTYSSEVLSATRKIYHPSVDDVDLTATDNYTVTVENNQVIISHQLDNNINSETFDFTPITFEIKITLTKDTSISQTIKVIQYPSVYVIADKNSDADNIKVNNIPDSNPRKAITYYGFDENGNRRECSFFGYVFVNGYYGHYNTYSGDDYPDGCFKVSDNWFEVANFDAVTYLGDPGVIGDGKNAPYLYVISVSDVAGSNYIIGDPREINHLSSNSDVLSSIDFTGWSSIGRIINCKLAQRPSLYASGSEESYNNGTRKLEYYLPTKVNYDDGINSSTFNMIAPRFRISSGFGASGQYNNLAYPGFRGYYDAVKIRCASYQEDGRPAGRWRLPTKAEIEYVNILSNRGLLSPIFNDGMFYWCAHGLWYEDTCLTESFAKYTANAYRSYTSLRCVYDEWYWELVDKNDPHFEQNENGFYLLKDGDGVNDLDGSKDDSDNVNYRAQFFWGDMPRNKEAASNLVN